MFRIHRAGTVLLGLGAILLVQPMGAQEPTDDGARGAGVLVNAGLGVGSPFDAAGHVGLSVVDALPVDLIVTLSGNGETDLFGPSDNVASFGLLAGLRIGEGKIWFRPALRGGVRASDSLRPRERLLLLRLPGIRRVVRRRRGPGHTRGAQSGLPGDDSASA